MRLTAMLCFALLAFILMPRPSGAADRIVIGQIIDLSGPNGAIGRDYMAGIKTHFDAVNAKGGVAGKRIRYIVHDDQGKPELAARLANELIAGEQVDYLLGGVGTEPVNAILASSTFRRSSLVLYAPLVTGQLPSTKQLMLWRPQLHDEMRYLYSYFSRVGIRDVGVVVQASFASGQELQTMSAEMRTQGINLVGIAQIGVNGERSTEEAARLAAAKPGLVLVFADSIAGGLFLKAFRAHASQTFVAGTSLTNLETLREVAGAAALEWTLFSQVVPNPHTYASSIQAEHIAMMRKFRDEAMSSLTLEGFAAAKALVRMIETAGNYRAALQEFRASKNAAIDLGGLTAVNSAAHMPLSGYLDIALIRKGSRLVY